MTKAASPSSPPPADFFSSLGWAGFSLLGSGHKQESLPNQDRVFAAVSWMGENDRVLFALCDGHGQEGHLCAEFLLEHLTSGLIELGYERNRGQALQAFCRREDRAIEQTYRTGGTTFVLADISPKDIFLAHVGDSRATALCSHGPYTLTKDHDANHISTREKEAIHRRGGIVLSTTDGKQQRVVSLDIKTAQGLAIYRSLGDRPYGRGPSPDPDLRTVAWATLTPYRHLVLWSDGAWYLCKDFYTPSLSLGRLLGSSDASDMALRLRQHIVDRFPDDDATAMVIDLSAFRPS